jgi:DNA-binding GntR family transcriptional regulator
MLAAEQAVRSSPRRGYFVRDLTLEEAESIYPIRALLDPEALRLAGIPDAQRLDRLKAICDELGRTASVVEAIRLDEAWHRELWSGCPNPVLVDLIEQFISRTRRYELVSMGQTSTIRRTTDLKTRIIEDLRAGDMEGACRHLHTSLTTGGLPVFEWLRNNQKKRPETDSS